MNIFVFGSEFDIRVTLRETQTEKKRETETAARILMLKIVITTRIKKYVLQPYKIQKV